jgi:hypothetical protein
MKSVIKLPSHLNESSTFALQIIAKMVCGKIDFALLFYHLTKEDEKENLLIPLGL